MEEAPAAAKRVAEAEAKRLAEKQRLEENAASAERERLAASLAAEKEASLAAAGLAEKKKLEENAASAGRAEEAAKVAEEQASVERNAVTEQQRATGYVELPCDNTPALDSVV